MPSMANSEPATPPWSWTPKSLCEAGPGCSQTPPGGFSNYLSNESPALLGGKKGCHPLTSKIQRHKVLRMNFHLGAS